MQHASTWNVWYLLQVLTGFFKALGLGDLHFVEF